MQLLRVPSPRQPQGDQVATSYNKSQCRDAVLPEEEPARFPFRAEGTVRQLAELRRALTLLHLFGGLGSRSRRGWGSVEVGADFLTSPPREGPIEAWVGSLLKGVWREDVPVGAPAPRFSAFTASSRVCVTMPSTEGYEAVLFKFHEHFRRVRSWPDRATLAVIDHDRERDDARDGDGSIRGVPARLAFGMPYQPRAKGGEWEIEYLGRSPSGREVTRRSSPLLLKVHRLGGDRHVGVALFLPAAFFGDPTVEVGAKGKPLTQPFPGYGAIDEYFNSSEWTAVDLS